MARRSRSASPRLKARQHVGDAHHLFLIDNHAQRILQDRFKLRQAETPLCAPPLALDEVVDHVHRAGTEQGVERVSSSTVSGL
jgi:hypothetical protein